MTGNPAAVNKAFQPEQKILKQNKNRAFLFFFLIPCSGEIIEKAQRIVVAIEVRCHCDKDYESRADCSNALSNYCSCSSPASLILLKG
ncbi:hypothetical protein CEXT_549841 [Caerostris extrusa]|uniref:Uncharacterized protein n=1 Tax=Caerostris extrusa TaxID=172846 RepID=A0AAV4S8Y8_CAEEX|nr:hypothetical protein CEXT_549841 [Caerostris extrusa]